MENLTIEQLKNKYAKIPSEMKETRRWICYNIETDPNTKEQKKVPINPITGKYARSNDSMTWSTFNIALSGCVKYKMVGIGFMLGEDATTHTNYFGIDLDNHEDKVTNKKPMTSEEFSTFSCEFINSLNSYTEYSHSGEGIHIICKGKLPVGARRKAGCPVEMYERGRFFTMTGNVVNATNVEDRTEEIKPLWEKYLNTTNDNVTQNAVLKPTVVHEDGSIEFGDYEETEVIQVSHTLTDEELMEKIRTSQNGPDFISLYNGNMSNYGNDHSAADMALCSILAFWTGCNPNQMDRIFRSSYLMREKWDQKRSATQRRGVSLSAGTYGSQTIEYAISSQRDVYVPSKEKIVVSSKPQVVNKTTPNINSEDFMQFDDKGDPIIKIKQIFKSYSLTDTGNAERFYDYFGDIFRYNTDNKCFMFWNGKTWISDAKNYVRKYADKIIDILKSEITNTRNEIKQLSKDTEANAEKIKELQLVEKAQIDNAKKVANKTGKDSMINELQHLHDIPVVNSEFDTQENLLNTDSGVVDLDTGKIMPFDKNLKLSKNTNCEVSFEEPTVWLKFLHDLLERNNEEETQELIDFVRMALGLSLTGRTNKDQLFILYGSGSNGKSTFVETVRKIFGDYGISMNSDLLIQNNNSSSQSNEFSMASLLGARFVSTSETGEGKKLDEVTIKKMTSGEQINAQIKHGKSFTFSPTFSPWMSTNNKPIIRATDFGTWRRMFFIPFLNTFSGEKKDINMPKKLKAEYPKILGWMIQGNVQLNELYKGLLPKPKCLEIALADYKREMDVIASFIQARCVEMAGYKTSAALIYQEYKNWCRDNTEYLMSETKFKLELPKRGYSLVKDANAGLQYVGLKLDTDQKGHVFADDD